MDRIKHSWVGSKDTHIAIPNDNHVPGVLNGRGPQSVRLGPWDTALRVQLIVMHTHRLLAIVVDWNGLTVRVCVCEGVGV